MADEKNLTIVADIGGTNARFAALGSDRRPGPMAVLATADYPGPGEALADYLRLSRKPFPRVLILALAGPVNGDEASLTNLDWRFSIKDLQTKLGLERLEVLNDFEAAALALPHLSSKELVGIGPKMDPGPECAPLAVLGPGTGLGMAGLMPDGEGWRVIPSEGGYTALAPSDDRELAAWKILRSRYGRVSKERVLSGPGLTALHQALALADGREPGVLSPQDIVRQALNGESGPALETVEMFCAWLGDAAGDTALMYNARGGVYLAGGIVPRIIDILSGSRFRQRFEDKDQGGPLLARIPTFAVTAPSPALLGGAALAAGIG